MQETPKSLYAPFNVGLLAVCFFLAGCTASVPHTICPQLVPWSASFQQQAAVELRSNPALVALPEIARQSVMLRDQVRACQKGS